MKPRIGVTGGIGSGKSTISERFAQLGCAVIDADQIARGLTLPGGAAIAAIQAQFGAHFITQDGALDRAQMREAIFQNPAAKQRLEAILHPLIQRSIFDCYADACSYSNARLVIFDIPLLAESGQWSPQLDQVIVVDCEERTQLARVQARSQLSAEAVAAIMAFFALCLVLTLAAMAPLQLGWPWWLGVSVALAQMLWHFYLIRGRIRDGCFVAFSKSHWIGVSLWLGVVLAYALR